MAEFGQRRKPVIPVKKSDLKQAILKKNKALEEKNKGLDASLKSKNKELKSLDKEYSSDSKKYGKLLKDIEFQEERMSKINGGIYSNERLLADKLKKVSMAEQEWNDYKDTVLELEERERKLLDEIAKLEFYKSKCTESKNELAGIQVKKDNALDELEVVKASIDDTVKEGNSKIAYYEDQYDLLEEKAKKHEDMVCQFEQRLFDTEAQFKGEEKKLRQLLNRSKVEKEKTEDELQALKNLCNDTEDKYIQWEQKVAKAKAKADKEEGRNEKAIERFKKWKIGVLEEVARLKLKNKVDKIDKAGLSDILNNG